MKRKTISIAAASILLGVGGATFLSAAAAESAAHPARAAVDHSPLYASCGVVAPRKPVDAQLDCRFPGYQLDRLTWQRWGASSASGEGRIGVASSLTDDPTYTWYPVTVRLSDPEHVRGGVVFSKLTFDYTGARPAGAPAETTVPLTGDALQAATGS